MGTINFAEPSHIAALVACVGLIGTIFQFKPTTLFTTLLGGGIISSCALEYIRIYGV